MFNEKLKQLRLFKNLKQDELGDIFGVSKGTVSSWESGRTRPPYETLKDIAHFFNVTTDYLLGIDTEGLDEEKIKSILMAANIMDPDGNLSLEELGLAIKSYQQFKNQINKKDTINDDVN